MRSFILGSFILAAAGSTQAQAGVAVDLSHYDCSGIDTAAAPDSQQFGQIVGGAATEWRAFFATEGGTRRVKCITVTRPNGRTLTRDDARAFLAAAMPPRTASTAKAPAASAVAPSLSSGLEAHVRAEPLKAKPAAVGAVSTTAPLAASQEASAVAPSAAPMAAALAAPNPPTSAATLTGTVRNFVTDATKTPFRGIGYLLMTFPNGDTVRCTGSLISHYAVLTAGACVHNAARGGYAVAAAFYPGQYEATAGDGKPIRPLVGKTDAASFRTTQHWTEISGNSSFTIADQAYNWGAVLFKTPYRYETVTTWGKYFDDSFPLPIGGTTWTHSWVSGYPTSVNGKASLSQYAGEGDETQDSLDKYDFITHTREFALPATAGDVGAPLYIPNTMFDWGDINSIVTYADDKGTVVGGPTIDAWSRPLLLGWQAWAPPLDPAPQEATSDLRVASIFSTNQSASQSYLRFHNAGSTTGKVTVDLKNPTTGATVATWTSTDIAGGSELQVFIADIERMATTTGAKPFNYAMSVKPTFEGYFQHVLWQVADNTLTNLTSCDTGATNDPKTLVAVHSSLLKTSYPSLVVVYNSGDAAADISLGISDARNGTRLGTYHVGLVQAGGQAVVNVSDMEKAASPKITPANGMYHYVISADTMFSGYLQHIVQNTGNGVLTDMSIVCKLSPQS